MCWRRLGRALGPGPGWMAMRRLDRTRPAGKRPARHGATPGDAPNGVFVNVNCHINWFPSRTNPIYARTNRFPLRTFGVPWPRPLVSSCRFRICLPRNDIPWPRHEVYSCTGDVYWRTPQVSSCTPRIYPCTPEVPWPRREVSSCTRHVCPCIFASGTRTDVTSWPRDGGSGSFSLTIPCPGLAGMPCTTVSAGCGCRVSRSAAVSQTRSSGIAQRRRQQD